MKIGVDIHEVLDAYPLLFIPSMAKWIDDNHEVHLLTGSPWEKASNELKVLGIKLGIHYTHFYSIVDYNMSISNPTMYLEESGWWMSKESWNRSKGEYAARVSLNVMFESDGYYAPYFPPDCTFIKVPKEHFDKAVELLQG